VLPLLWWWNVAHVLLLLLLLVVVVVVVLGGVIGPIAPALELVTPGGLSDTVVRIHLTQGRRRV